MVALWSILSIIFMIGVCTKSGVSLCISTFGLILHVVNIVWCIWGFFNLGTPAALTAMGETAQAEPSFTTEATASFSTDPTSSGADTMEVSGIAWWIIFADLAVIAVLYIIFPIVCCIASLCASKDDD